MAWILKPKRLTALYNQEIAGKTGRIFSGGKPTLKMTLGPVLLYRGSAGPSAHLRIFFRWKKNDNDDQALL